MDCYAFADAVVRPDSKITCAIDEPQILGLAPKDRALVDGVSRAERCKPLDYSVGTNIAAFPDARFTLDNGIRAYAYAVVQPCSQADYGCVVYVHERSILTCVFGLEYCCPLLALIVFLDHPNRVV